jgi:hypothetical protein
VRSGVLAVSNLANVHPIQAFPTVFDLPSCFSLDNHWRGDDSRSCHFRGEVVLMIRRARFDLNMDRSVFNHA